MTSDLEYESLRQEIIDEQNREDNIVNWVFTATAAIIGYGLTASNPESLIFLVPLGILGMLLLELNNILYSALIKAVYIRLVIESRSNELRWEHFIHDWRSVLRKRKESNHLIFASHPYAMMATGTGFICIFLSYYYANHIHQQLLAIISAIGWLLVSVRINRRINYAVSGRYEKDLEDQILRLGYGIIKPSSEDKTVKSS